MIRTLRKFAAVETVSEIWIALRENEIAGFRERMEKEAKDVLKKKVELVVGGEHRQQSVESALGAVAAAPDDIVLVHDAVRPLIEPAVIRRVIEAVEKHSAAIVGLPALDTIKLVERTEDGAIITATIPREYIVQAQTPQGFRYGLLQRAFAESEADGFVGTDEASLVERAGSPVFVVLGSASNLKITQPGDLELAEFYLEHRGNSH